MKLLSNLLNIAALIVFIYIAVTFTGTIIAASIALTYKLIYVAAMLFATGAFVALIRHEHKSKKK